MNSASIVEEKANFHAFEPYKIILSTTLPIAEDERFGSQLKSYLQNATKRRWDVEVLPF
jgi:hypothetical protein